MILIDATPLQTEHRYRGPGVYTSALLDALTRDGADPPLTLLVEASRRDEQPALRMLLDRDGVSHVRLHRPARPRYRLHAQLSHAVVRLALRRARPRVYHATEPHGLILQTGTRTVATLYDLIPLRHLEAHYPMRRLDQRLGYARYLQALQGAAHIIAISEASKRDAVERLHIPPERITVTWLAVDQTLFYPRGQEEIAETVQQYALQRPYFLHVGASTYHKNTEALLRAFHRFVVSDWGDHHLYIVGRWMPRAGSRLLRAYDDLLARGRLRVLGYVPESSLPALYGGADALLYPSLFEGFGLPVLEAMRCGTPVLTSTTSSLPEVAGEAALLVDPRSEEELAEGLRRLADDAQLRVRLAAAGLERAESFTWERTAAATKRVYQELL